MRLLPFALALAGVALVPAFAPAAESPRHNVVLLVADDLGMEVGCYGNKVIKTPNIDALAKNGTRFTNSFATVSSCSPSRACLYSGLYTHTSGQYGLAHGEHHFRSQEKLRSLPRVLKEAGYRCGILGKNHVAPPEAFPFDKEIMVNTRSVAEIAKLAKGYITESGDKPFCLIVGYGDPHRGGPNFANNRTYPGVKETKYNPKDMIVPWFLPEALDTREDLAQYYQSVSRLDFGIGLLLDALKETKHADDTLVIFLSDNGIPFPGAKTNLYDPGLNLPLIISSPAQKKRAVVNEAMVSYIDITPTILDWMNVKSPPLPGRSLLPILEQEKPAGWDVVYGSHQFHEITMYYPMRMIRTRTHKLILNLANPLEYPTAADLYGSQTWQGVLKRGDKTLGLRQLDAYLHRPHEELYDLEKDPHELKNVVIDSNYADVLKDLRARMKDWQEKTKDPWVVKYKHE